MANKKSNKKKFNPKNVKQEELVNAIMEMGGRLNETMKYLNQLDRLFGLFIEMEGLKEKFNKFIEQKVEEKKNLKEMFNDSEGDGSLNPENLQGDTDGESSRTEGVRTGG